MKVEKIVAGYLANNIYIVGDDKEVVIIDPAADYQKIMEVVGKRKILAVLITHKHPDHIGALDEFLNRGIKEISFDTIKDKKLKIGNMDFIIRHNPGHSKDSISFLIDKHFFCGDFLFEGSIGRTDFPGGSMEEMIKSIKELNSLDEDYILYPGHGDETSLSKEKKTNPFLINYL